MTVTFETLIQHNKRMSLLLVGGMAIFTAVVFGAFLVAMTNPAPEMIPQLFAMGGLAGIATASTGASISYFFGGNIVAGITGARKVDYSEDPVLYNVVEEIAIAAGLPPPKIYVIFDGSPNAFATGRDPKHAIIGITTGLRSKLTRDELQAVIAHEMGHIKNYDILLMMLVGVFAGLIVLVSDFFVRHALDTVKLGGRRRGSSKSSSHGSGFYLVALLAALVLGLVAPIIAKLLQLAVSREREYLADATAVQLCRNPLALASALRKISLDPDVLDGMNRAVEHMFIVNPEPKRRMLRSDRDTIWSTHPPAIKRISKLRAMAGEYPQAEPPSSPEEHADGVEFSLEEP